MNSLNEYHQNTSIQLKDSSFRLQHAVGYRKLKGNMYYLSSFYLQKNKTILNENKLRVLIRQFMVRVVFILLCINKLPLLREDLCLAIKD